MTAALCTGGFLEWKSRALLGDCRYSYSSHLFGEEFLHKLQIALESDWKHSSSSHAYHEGEFLLARFESTQKCR